MLVYADEHGWREINGPVPFIAPNNEIGRIVAEEIRAAADAGGDPLELILTRLEQRWSSGDLFQIDPTTLMVIRSNGKPVHQ